MFNIIPISISDSVYTYLALLPISNAFDSYIYIYIYIYIFPLFLKRMPSNPIASWPAPQPFTMPAVRDKNQIARVWSPSPWADDEKRWRRGGTHLANTFFVLMISRHVDNHTQMRNMVDMFCNKTQIKKHG